MGDWKLPWSASCLCRRVTMRISAPPLISAACHCTGCQKLTGGAYSLTLMLPAQGFEVLEGETVRGGEHRPESHHHHCAHCKGWLYTTGDAIPGMVNFRPTMLDDARWVMPYIETMTAEKLPGVVSGAVRSYEGWAPPEEFGALMEAFATDGARPH